MACKVREVAGWVISSLKKGAVCVIKGDTDAGHVVG